MEADMGVVEECEVSGLLSVVLHVSRVAGMGPLTFTKVRGGWRVSLSRFWHLYGHVIVIILLIMISCFTFQNRKDVVDGYDSATNTWFINVMKASLTIMRLVVAPIIIFTSYDRMRSFIDCTAKVHQINQQFDRLFEPSPVSEIKLWFIVILAIIHAYVAVSMEYGGFMNDMIAANEKIPISSCFFCATFIYMLHLQMYPLQFFLVVLRLVAVMTRLNSYLRKMIDEARSHSSAAWSGESRPKYAVMNRDAHLTVSQPIPNHSITKVIDLLSLITTDEMGGEPGTVRVLAHMYCSMCDIVRNLNHSNGLSFMMFLVYIALYTVTAPYFVVAMLFRNQSEFPAFRVLCIFAWCTLCFAMLAMLTEPCHRAHYQMVLTKRLVNQLLRFTHHEATATINHELKLFRIHILLNPVSFSPMRFLLFNRTLLIGVFSTIITYLTVMINL